MRPQSFVLHPLKGYTSLQPTVRDSRNEQVDHLEMHQRPPPAFSSSSPSDPLPGLDQKSRDSKEYLNNDLNEPPVRHWPLQSQQVAKMSPRRGFVLFLDVVLASTPIAFIALALVAASLNGTPVDTYGHKLGQALFLSPTIFPVIFAALMGRCFKHVGLFLAERGTTLGRLEQLVGCQSLFSALERQIALRSWSVVGLLLTLVWCLSPLGGQSALRLLVIESKAVNLVGTYQYLDPLGIQSSFLLGASAINSGRSTFTSLSLAALLSSTKYQNTSMDLWGNVKMPAYRSIINSTADGMKIVSSSDESNGTYASLIGIPVSSVRSTGYSNYSLRARQWDITCSSNEEMSINASSFGNVTATWKLNDTDGSCDNYPCTLSLKSLDSLGNVSVASCAASYGYYEANVSCNGTVCRADTMRELDLLEDGYTQDIDDFLRTNIFKNIMTVLPTLDNFGVSDAGARGSTYMERWMVDPWNFIGARYDNVDIYKLSPELLAQRLTIVFNTFFQSTYATTALGGNLPNNLTELSVTDPLLTFNATQAHITDVSRRIYKTEWRWFSALLVASIILQIAAYVGLVLKYITLAPDIIGYASSLTILNPYVPGPSGGTTLRGLERSALLHDMPVRIGDVCDKEAVGAIAMARSDLGIAGRLDRRKLYI